MISKSALVALYAVSAAAAPAAVSEPIHLPVSRGSNHYEPRANGDVDGPLFFKVLNNTLKKYGSSTLLPALDEGLLKRATVNEPLVDQNQAGSDILYYGVGRVGATSPQLFTFDFDTGSADLFVPGPKCAKAQGCVGTTKYDQGGQALGNSTSITYGSGSVSGNNYLDTVCVAGLCAEKTNVISLTTAKGFSTSASNSLMGMGFSTIANSKQPTFFERLMALGKVTKNEFAFYLGRAKSGTQKNSQMTLGGINTKKYTGAVTSHKVTTKGYWQIALDGIKVRKVNTPLTAGQAAIDTGTTIILAPTVAATAVFAQIPGSLPLPLVSGSPTITVFAYPCNTKVIPSITFGGVDYSINPLDFSLGTINLGFAELLGKNGLTTLLDTLTGGGVKVCLSSLAAADLKPAENLYVVGDTFLKSWYSIYSYDNGGSVSFAKAV